MNFPGQKSAKECERIAARRTVTCLNYFCRMNHIYVRRMIRMVCFYDHLASRQYLPGLTFVAKNTILVHR